MDVRFPTRSDWALSAAALAFASVLAVSRPLLEPDEARDAEIARTVLAADSWAAARATVTAGGGSSPFTIGASALGQAAFGANEFGARAITVFAFGATVLLVLSLARELGASSAAPIAAATFALSPLAAASAGFLSPDAVSAAAQTLGVLAAIRVFQAKTAAHGWRWTFYGAFGVAALAKGAMGLVGIVPVLLVFAARRRRKVGGRLWAPLPALLCLGLTVLGLRFAQPPAGTGAAASRTTALFAVLAALLPWSISCPRLAASLRAWWRTPAREVADRDVLLGGWIGAGILFALVAGSERLFCGTPLLVPLAIVFARAVPGILRPLSLRCAVALAAGLSLAFVLAARQSPRFSKLDDAPRELGLAIRSEADGSAAILDATGFGLSSVGFYARQDGSVKRLPRSSVLGVTSPAGLRDREVAPVDGASRTFLLVRSQDLHGLEPLTGYVQPRRDAGDLSLLVVTGIR